MKRRAARLSGRVLLALAAALWPLGAAAQLADPAAAPAPAGQPDEAAAPAPLAAEQQQLYRDALRALAEGHPDTAATLLAQLVEKEPRHAGAWLDLAISECELGNADKAEQLFQDTERLFHPPPSIMEVIEAHRAAGCHALPVHPASWLLSVGRGRDSNVNQGPSNPLFSSADGDLQLAPEFLPRADNYTALAADYFRPLDNQGTLGIVQLRSRLDDHVHDQDNTSLLAGIERPWQLGDWRARTSGSYGLVHLDGALYQRQVQLQLRLTPPLPLPDHYDLSMTGGFSHVQYPTRPQYDANALESGVALGYHGTRSQVQLAAGVQDEHGRDARPGGNRQGWYGDLQWNSHLSERLDSEFTVSHQDWQSARAYSPGLIDQLRHQQTDGLRAAVLYALHAHQTLLLEWRQTRNRENISLFQYDSRVFQLSWRWDNF